MFLGAVAFSPPGEADGMVSAPVFEHTPAGLGTVQCSSTEVSPAFGRTREVKSPCRPFMVTEELQLQGTDCYSTGWAMTPHYPL